MKMNPDLLRLYAITDRSWLKPGESLASVTETLLQNGVTILQLREKKASHEEMVALGRELLPVCRRYGVPLIINDDVQAALEIGADGVHVGQSDMAIREARELLGEGKYIGTSAHNTEEAAAAQAAGADYMGSGAVFGSTTKTDAGTLPMEELARICKATDLPVVAIGGISHENVLGLAGLGLSGVAVISALFAKEDKAEAAERMRRLADQVAE